MCVVRQLGILEPDVPSVKIQIFLEFKPELLQHADVAVLFDVGGGAH